MLDVQCCDTAIDQSERKASYVNPVSD